MDTTLSTAEAETYSYNPDTIEVTDAGVYNGSTMEPYAVPEDWREGPCERDLARAEALLDRGPVMLREQPEDDEDDAGGAAAAARAEYIRLTQLGPAGWTAEIMPALDYNTLSDDAKKVRRAAWRKELNRLDKAASENTGDTTGTAANGGAPFRDPDLVAREVMELHGGRAFSIIGSEGVWLQVDCAARTTDYGTRPVKNGRELDGRVQTKAKWGSYERADVYTRVYSSLRELAPQYKMALRIPTTRPVPGTVYAGPDIPEPSPDYSRFTEQLAPILFCGEVDKALATAYALGTVHTFANQGQRPITHISAPDGGNESGKSHLWRLLTAPAKALDGALEASWNAARAKFGDPWEPVSSLLAKEYVAGHDPRALLIDNVDGDFGSDLLDTQLTNPDFRGRTLKQCEYVNVPFLVNMAVTGNSGFNPRQDVAARMVSLFIKPFTGIRKDLEHMSTAKAAGIVADMLAVIRSAPAIDEASEKLGREKCRFPTWAVELLWPACWFTCGRDADRTPALYAETLAEIAKRQAELQASSVAVDEITRGFLDLLETSAKDLKVKCGGEAGASRRMLYEEAVWCMPWGVVARIARDRNVSVNEFRRALQKNKGGNWVWHSAYRQCPQKPVFERPCHWNTLSQSKETRRRVNQMSSVVYWFGAGVTYSSSATIQSGEIDVLDYGTRLVRSSDEKFSRKEEQVTFAGRVGFEGVRDLFRRSVESRKALGFIDEAEAARILDGMQTGEGGAE